MCLNATFVVGFLSFVGKPAYWEDYGLRNLVRLPGVNGFNVTETIDELVRTGVPFHDLSKGHRKWGKLATFLTKIKMLDYQIEHAIPYQVYLDDDLRIMRGFEDFVAESCARHLSSSDSTALLKMSGFGEIFMLTLRGAEHMRRLLQTYGIRKGDDQVWCDPRVLENRFSKISRNAFGHHVVGLRKAVNSHHPGSISTSRAITPTELYLLRRINARAA